MAREYGTSVDSSASPEKVWRIWSDMSTWGEWNPNVATMDWQGGFASGTTGVMNTRAGQHHRMQLVDVQPGRSFALITSVVPGTKFRFNCRNGARGHEDEDQPDGRGRRPARAGGGRHAGAAGLQGLRHSPGQPGPQGRVLLGVDLRHMTADT